MKLTILALAATLASSTIAGALSAAIASHQLPHPSAMDAATEKKVGHVHDFIAEKMPFLEGRFFNQFTSYTLGGSMDDAASLIWLMREADVWEVKVSLTKLDSAESAIRVSLDGSNTVSLHVNSARADFDKAEFERFDPIDQTALLEELDPDPSLTYMQSLLHIHESAPGTKKKAKELAAADIKAGRARLFAFGMRRAGAGGEIDKESGLPIVPAAGCCISKPFANAVAIYNAAMRKHASSE